MNDVKQDPEKYARMAAPFADDVEAGAVLAVFYEKVRQLRESYRIAEVCVVAAVYVEVDDTEQLKAVSSFFTFGSLSRHFPLMDAATQSLAMQISRAMTPDINPFVMPETDLGPDAANIGKPGYCGGCGMPGPGLNGSLLCDECVVEKRKQEAALKQETGTDE